MEKWINKEKTRETDTPIDDRICNKARKQIILRQLLI